MNASPSRWFYRSASVLLVLFAVGHTLDFRQTDPHWGVDALVASMRAIHFDVLGFNRTYWDFFVGNGLFVSAFLLFAAVLAWQLGGMSQETLKLMPVVTWTLALLFVGLTILSGMYLFTVPVVFCGAISLCLVAGAWRAGSATSKLAP